MRRSIISSAFFVIVFWVFFTSFYFLLIQSPSEKIQSPSVVQRLEQLEREVKLQSNISQKLLHQFFNLRHGEYYENKRNKFDVSDAKKLQPVIGILVIACNRVEIKRCLNLLLKYRPLKKQFPIVVSQDCAHKPTTEVIKSYGNDVTLIQQPDQSDIPLSVKDKKFKGYYKIARHYKWALNQMFNHFNYESIIIVEDDLDIAPDFYEYFLQSHSILQNDPTLWCVSAWNDNGKEALVNPNEPELLYRTDFFPGLGWMIRKDLWQELEPKWPKSFWDDWMRNPEQRLERACIRPEISRTKTFGKIGVSKGLFFEKHLKFMKLNNKKVPFENMDLSNLLKDNYDSKFVKIVYDSQPISIQELKQKASTLRGSFRITYRTKEDYKKSAKAFGLMDDFKSGVPRAGYRGIVSFMFKEFRVFLAPPADWKGYNVKWS